MDLKLGEVTSLIVFYNIAISWLHPPNDFLFNFPLRDSATQEYEIQKTLNLSRTIVSLQVFVDVSRVSPCVINLSRNKNVCCGLKRVVAKSRARVYFERQTLALLLVFHQTHNLSRNKFARALANQPISAPHFFNQHLLRVKLIKQGEKRETSTKLTTKQCCATSWGFL